ncbi:MAG: AAA family ATPase [Microcella pacifica]|uniref:ATP-dependent nuclease n=1 Tax=Microcella pacifica TaxID=2591847 RepID=UPI003314E420
MERTDGVAYCTTYRSPLRCDTGRRINFNGDVRMRVKSVGVRNFRCLDEVYVEFDQITTFIGPNGAGKSTVLRALDWFFNGDKSVVLTEEDVFSGADDDKKIVVRVGFDQLSSKDRDLLGEKYEHRMSTR